jgi:hypothetical protein
MNICTINIKDKDYELCLTRQAIKEIEAKGFNVQNFVNKPVTYMEVLWYGGFVAKHPNVNFNLATKLMDSYKDEGGDVNEVINFLADEYSNFVNAPADTKSTKKAKIVKA